MTIADQLTGDIANAMRARDRVTLDALRMLKTALTNRQVEKGRSLDEAEEVQTVTALVKQRRDSIEQFGRAGRQDLVDKETAEIAVLERYLPPAADPREIERAVDDAIAETGAASPKDLGKVMKAAMTALAGKSVDGRAVNDVARRRLGG